MSASAAQRMRQKWPQAAAPSNHRNEKQRSGWRVCALCSINSSRDSRSADLPKPAWLEELLRRRPLNVAVVALANKMARTAWALVAHGRAYRPEWKSTPPSGCGAQAQAA